MLLYFYQIEELLDIINKNQKVAASFGPEIINSADKRILLKHGVDINRLLDKNPLSSFNPFNFAMLAESLYEVEKNKWNYDQLLHFIKRGKYLPESPRNVLTLQIINGMQFNEIVNIPHFKRIRELIIEGVQEHYTTNKIISNIGHETGNWSMQVIIPYYLKYAWENATAALIRKNSIEPDQQVYKMVHEGCCEKCIQLYNTAGYKSEPRIFGLFELEKNGSNIGKNKQDWKPTIVPTHYDCECSLSEVPKGYLWSIEKQSFATSDPEYLAQTKSKRPLIKVWIGGVEKYL